MTQINIVDGIYADVTPQLRTSYPVNYKPVPKQTGISNGYLQPADGIVALGTGPGIDRGGINWDGVLYRVMGSMLGTVSSTGAFSTVGDVGGNHNDLVTLDYSFDDLAIASNGNLFVYNPTDGLRQNVDPDLGVVLDVIWIDGYFMTTDGEFLVVTELGDPLSVNPLKYGSSEADPDPIVALLKLRNEAAALNRYTIEFFDNTGGNLFPFTRIEGAQIEKGCIGTHACCIYQDAIAFLGGGFNEQVSVYIGANATTQQISTQEIDTLLRTYPENVLAACKMEARNDNAHWFLMLHLPDRTLVFDAAATAVMQQPVWFILTTAQSGDEFDQYRAQNFVWVYNKWIGGDPQEARTCYLVQDVSSHYGNKVRWEFATQIVYNEGNGAIFNQLELIALSGSAAFGADAMINTSYTLDGVTWSNDVSVSAGATGDRQKRLVWFRQGHMRNWRAQRFRGDSGAHTAVARLEARLSPLGW